ncbi:MAG: DUF4954 family protein [Sedimentisphaerales bacterium]|nr:DUF4954 family protein [Sedimentisphaerales bacterium]
MSQTNGYRNLTNDEIEALGSQGCSARNWNSIKVGNGFDTKCVQNSKFFGSVRIGNCTGSVKSASGIEKASGIYNATIIDCIIKDNVRISNIGVHIANYDIDNDICIENVGLMQTNQDAAFGNGVEAAVLNEAGGREVVLFDELSAQFAYLMCIYRYHPAMVKKLNDIAHNYANSVRAGKGKIDAGARINSAAEIIDVNIGRAAQINGVSSLVNGTILSSQEAPTLVGSDVTAQDFIIAEGSLVTNGAHLKKVFVGQSCLVGNHFSAENSLFFANCEAFHGEACSIFAGPYSVTHHKSTLLIAGLFSFYNAGSGTNQSNHMYKLGPTHEGKFERGTKSGSFSYVMWPCRVGPFSVILGKHTRTFDTSDYPFSHLEAEPDGKCIMIPGLYITATGTVRDQAKWLSRDRRKEKIKRDIIICDTFSPYTVGKVIKASARLKELYESTDRSIEEVTINGTQVKRVLLRTAFKFYRLGIEMYLLGKVFEKLESSLQENARDIVKIFEPAPDAVYDRRWVDIAGQLMPRKRLLELIAEIEQGKINTIETFCGQLQHIYEAYGNDEWVWVRKAYEQVFGCELESLTKENLAELAQSYEKVRTRFLRQVLADAEKEFDEMARTGFGIDGSEQEVPEDFREVRGSCNENKFVRQLQSDIDQVKQRVKAFLQQLAESESVNL